MKTYNKEKNEILMQEINLAIDNLESCMSFVHSLEITNKTYYEYDRLLDKYIMLNDLRTALSDCMYYEEYMTISKAEENLIKKWGWLNLQEYKALYSDIEE